MNKDDVLKLLEKAVMVKEGTLTLNTRLEELEEWDSLSQMTLLTYLDSSYDHLNISAFNNTTTVEDVIKVILS